MLAACLGPRTHHHDGHCRRRTSTFGLDSYGEGFHILGYNQDFHAVVIECCGNALLTIAAQPIFGVLQRNLARTKLGEGFHRAINDQHRTIAAAIEASDAEAAGAEMHAHLEYLRPYYERAWRE